MMNTRNFSIHLYRQNGRWLICRNDQCRDFALMNVLTNKRILIVAFMVVFVAVAMSFVPKMPVFRQTSTPVVIAEPDNKIQKDTVLPLTEENLLAEIKQQEIICEKHVLAQAKLESLHLTSYLCRNANNLFGMRYPGKRQTTAIGIYLQGENKIILGTRAELRKYLDKPTYAVYANWMDAVKDYKMWQDNAFKVEERYLTFLNGIYAQAPDYVQVVDKMAKNIQD